MVKGGVFSIYFQRGQYSWLQFVRTNYLQACVETWKWQEHHTKTSPQAGYLDLVKTKERGGSPGGWRGAVVFQMIEEGGRLFVIYSKIIRCCFSPPLYYSYFSLNWDVEKQEWESAADNTNHRRRDARALRRGGTAIVFSTKKGNALCIIYL